MEHLFTRIENDVYGNPRYTINGIDLAWLLNCTEQDLKRLKGIKKYAGSNYYVITSYNIEYDLNRMKEFLNKKYVGYYAGQVWATGLTRGELRNDFYKTRDELTSLFRLDHKPTYAQLTIKFE